MFLQALISMEKKKKQFHYIAFSINNLFSELTSKINHTMNHVKQVKIQAHIKNISLQIPWKQVPLLGRTTSISLTWNQTFQLRSTQLNLPKNSSHSKIFFVSFFSGQKKQENFSNKLYFLIKPNFTGKPPLGVFPQGILLYLFFPQFQLSMPAASVWKMCFCEAETGDGKVICRLYSNRVRQKNLV